MVSLLGRVWYAAAWLKGPAKRGPGFTLSMFAFVALTLDTAWGVLRAFLLSPVL